MLEIEFTNRFSHLIFDLDDTLMDTTGQLVEPAARESCEAMIQAGLDADLELCLQERARIFAAAPREDLYANLVSFFGVVAGADPDAVRLAGHNAFFHREVEDTIVPFDQAPELLNRLMSHYGLHLVTSGSPKTQQQKIDILGLEGYFKSVHLVHPDKGETKRDAFRNILKQEALSPAKVLCIGDRLDKEIKAAKSLGMATCHIHYGEFHHLEPESPHEVPDIRISHIRELAGHLSANALDDNG